MVGTRQEAQDVIDEWLRLNKPNNMLVDPAGGLTQQRWDDFCSFERGAERFIEHFTRKPNLALSDAKATPSFIFTFNLPLTV